jgi:hypothetical protein
MRSRVLRILGCRAVMNPVVIRRELRASSGIPATPHLGIKR